MLIAIDFDGTICKRKGIPRAKDFREDGKPMPEVSEALVWLINQGHELYVLTSRQDIHNIELWMNANGLPLLEITNIKKPGTKLIIDDRAIRFTNWQDICKYLG